MEAQTVLGYIRSQLMIPGERFVEQYSRLTEALSNQFSERCALASYSGGTVSPWHARLISSAEKCLAVSIMDPECLVCP